jgi:hypothetical protein
MIILLISLCLMAVLLLIFPCTDPDVYLDLNTINNSPSFIDFNYFNTVDIARMYGSTSYPFICRHSDVTNSACSYNCLAIDDTSCSNYDVIGEGCNLFCHSDVSGCVCNCLANYECSCQVYDVSNCELNLSRHYDVSDCVCAINNSDCYHCDVTNPDVIGVDFTTL